MKFTPFWWEAEPEQPPLRSELPSRCELLIVGAGYTGLTAALTAAEQGVQVCVVDAEHPGFGASSRNGGMCGAHPRQSVSAMVAKFGHTVARSMFNEAEAAFDHFQALIQRYQISCDFMQTGRIQLAWSEADFARQKAMAEEMKAQTNAHVEVLLRSELRDHIRTDHYFGGLYYPDHGGLHPKKFVDGLLKAAVRLGVTVVAPLSVLSISRREGGFHAVASNGQTLRADKVLMATNGYTRGNGALRWLSRRVFPVPSYIVATEELDANMLESLAPGGRMMVETHPRHSYWRRSPDGKRILWGSRAAIRQLDLQSAARRIQGIMSTIWPELKGVGLTHVWSGNTGFTFTAAPQIGQVEGIYFAAGYCGGGVVLAPYLGMKVARQILGLSPDTTAYLETTLQSRPFYFGGPRPLFLELADRWYTHIADRAANRKGFTA